MNELQRTKLKKKQENANALFFKCHCEGSSFLLETYIFL